MSLCPAVSPWVPVSPCAPAPPPTMPFGAVLAQVGGLGRFQVLQTVLLSVPILLMASHNLLQNFTAAVPPHRCRVPSATPAATRGPGATPGLPSATPGPPGATIRSPGGTLRSSNGTLRSSNAIPRSPDGTSRSSNGTWRSSNTILRFPDGTMGSPDGTHIPSAAHVTFDGTPESPDGTRVPPEATLGSSSDTLGPSEATLGWSNGTLGPSEATLGSCWRYVASAPPNGSSGPRPTEPCHDGWDYDLSIYVATIVNEVGTGTRGRGEDGGWEDVASIISKVGMGARGWR